MTLHHSNTWPIYTMAIVQIGSPCQCETQLLKPSPKRPKTLTNYPAASQNHLPSPAILENNFENNFNASVEIYYTKSLPNSSTILIKSKNRKVIYPQLHWIETSEDKHSLISSDSLAIDNTPQIDITCPTPTTSPNQITDDSFKILTDPIKTESNSLDGDKVREPQTDRRTEPVSRSQFPSDYNRITHVKSSGSRYSNRTANRNSSNSKANLTRVSNASKCPVHGKAMPSVYKVKNCKKCGDRYNVPNFFFEDEYFDVHLDPKKIATLCKHYYPEGGWGWVVALCSVLVHVLGHGLQLSCSQLAVPTAREFHQSMINTAASRSFINNHVDVNVIASIYAVEICQRKIGKCFSCSNRVSQTQIVVAKMDAAVLNSNIEAGLSVNIRRSDGRVHPAIISNVNWDNKCVTVEWFERGETKGKEVDFHSLFEHNPDLVIYPQIKAPSKAQIPSPNLSVQQRLVKSSSRGVIPTVTKGGSYRFANSRQTVNYMKSEEIVEKQNGRENVPPRYTTAVRHDVPQHTGGGTNSRQTLVMPQNLASATNVNEPPPTSRNLPKQSNVVKKVEALKKNREERRQRQAEEKAEKEALMNQDPGNPNWEFLNMIREYQADLNFRPLAGNEPVETHQITVCVRKRPLNKKEVTQKEVDVVSIPQKDTIVVHEPKSKVDLTKYLENQMFCFDYVFNEQCDNELVYRYTAQPLVRSIFEGGMATCFAYGQTGSGKTHTMGGVFMKGKVQNCKNGIYAMAARDVFQFLQDPKYRNRLMVSASFFEIYSGKVFDLLADKNKLRVLEDGKGQVQVVGLTEKAVDDVEEVLRIIQSGNTARTSGQTSANSNSSRSHAVFQIILRPIGASRIHGKFSLIDLAGNERGADTSSANRQTRMESAEINKSLLALKECIRALGRRNTHLPFRMSQLTQVLRDSFIGDNSRTCMIAMISPGMNSCEHTLNTLKYADRVKELAVVDPAQRKEDFKENEEDENMIVSDDDDMETLRSMNQNDMSADLLTLHQMIQQLQKAEDEVLDNHKQMLEVSEHFLGQTQKLFNMTKAPDYDQDAYSQRWQTLITQQIDMLTQANNLVAEFRMKLKKEEALSQNITSHNNTATGNGRF